MVQGIDPVVTQPLRRSERARHPTGRLDYPNFGNPLITVVKSLFQGLNTAFSDSLGSTNDYWLQDNGMQRDLHVIQKGRVEPSGTELPDLIFLFFLQNLILCKFVIIYLLCFTNHLLHIYFDNPAQPRPLFLLFCVLE